MTSPYKRRKEGVARHTGKKPYDDRGRDWSDVAVSQGILGTFRGWKKQGKILS